MHFFLASWVETFSITGVRTKRLILSRVSSRLASRNFKMRISPASNAGCGDYSLAPARQDTQSESGARKSNLHCLTVEYPGESGSSSGMMKSGIMRQF